MSIHEYWVSRGPHQTDLSSCLHYSHYRHWDPKGPRRLGIDSVGTTLCLNAWSMSSGQSRQSLFRTRQHRYSWHLCTSSSPPCWRCSLCSSWLPPPLSHRPHRRFCLLLVMLQNQLPAACWALLSHQGPGRRCLQIHPAHLDLGVTIRGNEDHFAWTCPLWRLYLVLYDGVSPWSCQLWCAGHLGSSVNVGVE